MERDGPLWHFCSAWTGSTTHGRLARPDSLQALSLDFAACGAAAVAPEA